MAEYHIHEEIFQKRVEQGIARLVPEWTFFDFEPKGFKPRRTSLGELKKRREKVRLARLERRQQEEAEQARRQPSKKQK